MPGAMPRLYLSSAYALLVSCLSSTTSTNGCACGTIARLGVHLNLGIVYKAVAVDAPEPFNLRPRTRPLARGGTNRPLNLDVIVREACAAAPSLRQHLPIDPARLHR